jgi:hypothetical protein
MNTIQKFSIQCLVLYGQEVSKSSPSPMTDYYNRVVIFLTIIWNINSTVFCNVTPYSLVQVHWRSGVPHSLHLRCRRIRKAWKQQEACAILRNVGGLLPIYMLHPRDSHGFESSEYKLPAPVWPTFLPFLFLYRWVFSTGGSVCSHQITLVPRSRIFLPWGWRRDLPPKSQFTQDLHGATSQKTAFLVLKICFQSGANQCTKMSACYTELLTKEARGSVVDWDTMLQDGRSRVRFQMMLLNFSIDLTFQPQYGPGVCSASNRNEYQESSWG